MTILQLLKKHEVSYYIDACNHVIATHDYETNDVTAWNESQLVTWLYY